MYKIAHRWFSAGFCAALSLAFGFTLITIILLTLFAMMLGPLPDSDQRIGFLSHRGVTHNPFFALLITFPLAILIVYIFDAINGFFNYSVLTTSVIDLNGVLVPGTFYYFGQGNVSAAFVDPFFLIFICLFLSMFTHFLLDIITPSGIQFFNKKYSLRGGLLSSDDATNKMFTSLGILLIVLSIIFKIGLTFDQGWSQSYSWLIPVTFLILIIVFLVAIAAKSKRESNRFKCYQMGDEKFCTRSKCVNIKGQKLCPMEDHLMD